MLGIAKFIAGVVAYIMVIWVVLDCIPAVSTAARTTMTLRLWLFDVAGFLWGIYLGSMAVFVFRGARPLAYGRWDTSRERPSSWLGDIIGLIFASAVGIFCANMTLEYALKHP
jgi:hypothetical protein